MSNIQLFQKASEIFSRGENVTEYFKKLELTNEQRRAVIEFAYDLQSGSYTESLMTSADALDLKVKWGKQIADVISECGAASFVEAGVGEASTLKFILDNVGQDVQGAGFDLSISRLTYARRYLEDHAGRTPLFTGDLADIPLVDNAFDAILSNHSIESNGGMEREILSEMMRVTRRFLILVEPDYEKADTRQRDRMDRLGYIRDLPGHLTALGAKILEYRRWELNPNPTNAASLIVAEKPASDNWNEPVGAIYASPFGKQALEERDGYYFSSEDNVALPVIAGFPCLLPHNAIIASHLNPAYRRFDG